MVQISIQNLTKVFPATGKRTAATMAVNDISLVIPSGSLFFLLGPSGCGKTTLLRMIAGFILPTSGRILFDDHDISTVPPYRRDTGMVFQSYALWPHMTIAENVAFGLDSRKIKNPEREARIDEALAMVQMGHLKDRKPNQLSGGQQQRVALARALAIRPQCLLLDEPLSNLDAKLRLEMRTEIRRIVKQVGITAIYVTHDQKEALSMADGIAVMREGRVEQTGTPTDLYRRPASRFVAGFVGECNFIEATVESVDGSMVLLKTAAGPMMAAARNGIKTGDRVVAAIRPEGVKLGEGGGAKSTRLKSRRVSTTYLGETAEHLIELPGGVRLKVSEINPSEASATGSGNVFLVIEAESIMLVPETA